MFSAYMVAQNKLQNVERSKQNKKTRESSSRGHMYDANGSSLSSVSATKPSSAQSLLFYDEYGEDDCDGENDDDGEVELEAAVAAARSIQSRGRRTPVQDALIHRCVPLLASTSISPATPCFMKANDRTAMREAMDVMKANDDGIEKLLELEVAYISVRLKSNPENIRDFLYFFPRF
jgi:hypothetical protein